MIAGVRRINPVARGAGAGFRLIILPGVVALLLRWIRRATARAEKIGIDAAIVDNGLFPNGGIRSFNENGGSLSLAGKRHAIGDAGRHHARHGMDVIEQRAQELIEPGKIRIAHARKAQVNRG